MTAPNPFSALDGESYLSLETFRRNGAGVRTPVWFAADGAATLFAYAEANSGKVKRIRRSGAVRIAACNIRGTVTGAWVDAHATLADPADYDRGMRLLDRKYWPWMTILGFFAGLRSGHQRTVIILRPAG